MGDPQFAQRQMVNTKTQFDYQPPGVDINLIMGIPAEVLLKKACDRFSRGFTHKLRDVEARKMLQYGPEAGELEFRTELAKFLSQQYFSYVRTDDLIATNGATQGLYMLASLLFSTGDLVFVEDPTFFVALKILQDDVGLKCVPVPIDGEGIIPEALEESLKAHLSKSSKDVDSRRPYQSMLYLISTFHNPTGVCLSPDRCKRIVQMARKYNLLVVCDDVYNLLAFSEDEESALQRKRLFAYDDPSEPDYIGNVVSNGTFSKIFGPGLRLGWQEVPQLVKKIVLTSGWLKSGGGLNHTTSGIMASILSLGLLEEHLKESRRLYKDQCDALCAVLQEKVPSATFVYPKGGYFLWVKLPAPLKAPEVLERCRNESKILFSTGDVASPTSQFSDCFRLSFSYYSVDVIKEAASKIADTIIDILNK